MSKENEVRINEQAELVIETHAFERLSEIARAFSIIASNPQIPLPTQLSVMYNYNDCLRASSAGNKEFFDNYKYHYSKAKGFWREQDEE